MLGWDELEIVAGMPIRPLFERFPGFVHLFSEVDRIIVHWVRTFYATVWIAEDREFIHFMANGKQARLYMKDIRKRLKVQTSERKLHHIVYGDVRPPWRGRAGGTFPIDDQIRELFKHPFTYGSPCTPDRLRPEVYVIHMALRKTVLPHVGNRESLTSLQQWLLLSIWKGKLFDFVDFFLSEIEDVIANAITTRRQQLYPNLISYLIAFTRQDCMEMYNQSELACGP